MLTISLLFAPVVDGKKVLGKKVRTNAGAEVSDVVPQTARSEARFCVFTGI
jgi:hypothetical protein